MGGDKPPVFLLFFWFAKTCSHELFSVFLGCNTSVFLEHSYKMFGTVKTQKLCNAFYGKMGVEQIMTCSLHSNALYKFCECHVGFFFYDTVKLTF